MKTQPGDKTDGHKSEPENRYKRIEELEESVRRSARRTSSLRLHMWLAAITVIASVIGTVIAAYYAYRTSGGL